MAYQNRPTDNQKRFAYAISELLDVYPEEETFDAYDEFISYYRREFYKAKEEARYY